MKSSRLMWISVFFALIIICIGCQQEQQRKIPYDTLAFYDSGVIKVEDLDQYLMSQPNAERVFPKKSEEKIEWIRLRIKRFLEQKIVAAPEKIDALYKDPGFEKAWDKQERLILTKAYIHNFEKHFSVSPKEISDYYQRNKKYLSIPEKRHVYNILLQFPPDASEKEKQEIRDRIKRIRQELIQGASFDDIARNQSDSVTSALGGLVGELKRDQLRPEVAKVVFALKPGEISNIVENSAGCQIFLVRQINPAHETEFRSLQNVIHKKLKSMKQLEWANEQIEKELKRQGVKLPDAEGLLEYKDKKNDEIILTLESGNITVGDLKSLEGSVQSAMAAVQKHLGEIIFSNRMKKDFPDYTKDLIEESKKHFAINWLLRKEQRAEADKVTDKELKEYFEVRKTRFMSDPMISLNLYSWPLTKGDPLQSIERPRQFALQLSENPDSEAQIRKTFESDPDFRVEEIPKGNLRKMLINRADLAAELLQDIHARLVIGPYHLNGRFQVCYIREYEKSTMPDFNTVKDRVLKDFVESNSIAMETRRLEQLSDRHRLTFVSENVANYGALLLDVIMAGKPQKVPADF